MKTLQIMVSAVLLAISAGQPVLAADTSEDLAAESMNPLSSLIAVPFENNILFNIGPSDTTSNVLNIKPVFPLNLGEWNLINRVTIPIAWSGGQEEEVFGTIDWGGGNPGSLDTGSAFGIGDITYQGFLTPSKTSGSTSWGLGGSIVMPTHSKPRFGTDKWSVGPAIVVISQQKKWFLGLMAQNVWSVAGDSDAADVNSFYLQPTINYKLGNGYYLTSAPMITANWKSESGNRWAIPIGGGLGRLMRYSGQAVAIDAGAYYYIERPEHNPDWYIQILCNFLFPKS
jgi:hypothetical protein